MIDLHCDLQHGASLVLGSGKLQKEASIEVHPFQNPLRGVSEFAAIDVRYVKLITVCVSSRS